MTKTRITTHQRRQQALDWVRHQLRWERTLDDLRTARATLETRMQRAA